MYKLRLLVTFFLSTILTLDFTNCYSQQIEYLDVNNLKVGLGTGGNLFSKIDTDQNVVSNTNVWGLFQSPKDMHTSPIYTAALWLSGFDGNGTLRLAGQRYAFGGADYYDGPIVSNYTTAYENFYKRVFKVTAIEINELRAHSTPIIVSDIADNILKWPAKGNPYVLQQYGVYIGDSLAPFIDVDANGVYDPAQGDYPDICGDEAVFFVFNDVRGPHNESAALPLGMEISGLAQVFIDNNTSIPYTKRVLNNTVFVTYSIKNKSANNYSNFYLGLFEDPDLGCYNNDRVGCDTARNLMYAYNGSVDANCNGALGYNTLKVSFGTIMLSQTLNSFCYFTNTANASHGDPTAVSSYRNYMLGKWADGTQYTHGGLGYGGTTTVKHIFSGTPSNPNEWTEANPSVASSLLPGDRRYIGCAGPTNFAAGATKRYDFAFTNSFDSTATFLTIVDTLKRDADLVQAFYDNYIANCAYQPVVGVPTLHNNLTVALVPNPATDEVQITSDVTITAVTIYDMQGKAVLTTTGNTNSLLLNTKALQRGLYLVKVEAGSSSITKKLALK